MGFQAHEGMHLLFHTVDGNSQAIKGFIMMSRDRPAYTRKGMMPGENAACASY